MPRKKSREHTTVWTILLHPAVWFVAATVMLIYLATSQWNQHRDSLLDNNEYAINSSNIKINPPPSWFQRPAQIAVDDLSKSKSSLLDPQIVPETHQYFSGLPWIRNVNQVSKSKQGIKIDLQYRTPVAFVDLDRHTGIPVDLDGTVFDRSLLNETEFSILRQKLMRISLRQLGKQGRETVPWQPWPDSRIPIATRLCQFLEPASQDLELLRVVSYDLPAQNSSPRLQVWTANGTVVIWGSAPGMELPGEAPAHVKLNALREFVSHNGPLTKFEQKNTLDIDITTGKVVFVKPSRFADAEKFRTTLLK